MHSFCSFSISILSCVLLESFRHIEECRLRYFLRSPPFLCQRSCVTDQFAFEWPPELTDLMGYASYIPKGTIGGKRYQVISHWSSFVLGRLKSECWRQHTYFPSCEAVCVLVDCPVFHIEEGQNVHSQIKNRRLNKVSRRSFLVFHLPHCLRQCLRKIASRLYLKRC